MSLQIRPYQNTPNQLFDTPPMSAATRISQEAWYLKLVSDSLCMIEDADFQWLLPVHTSLFVPRIFIPPFVQRLDPTGDPEYLYRNPEILQLLLEHFKCGTISLSKPLQDAARLEQTEVRTNFLLDLNAPYDRLHSQFHKGHKLNIRYAQRSEMQINESHDAAAFSRFYKTYSDSKIPSAYKNPALVANLVSECMNRKQGLILKAELPGKKTIAMAFFTQYKNRITYLISCSTPEGKALHAMHAVVNTVIERFSNQPNILDFEGSMLPGVAYFMKGFGSSSESYHQYHWNHRWACKIRPWIRNQFAGRKASL